MSERPLIPLAPGEQYRFHFDISKCIGCKCCEVACHEQNNNPVAVKWRKVGEVEGGAFPLTARLYISMACNHCLEPSCLLGCPVDAYYKDPVTGAVRMKDDICIGCGYCTWNCPYEAPQMNADRNMVTKCDFCHNRLVDGDLPACVNACPSSALEVEAVNVADWRKDFAAANAPGVPEASITVSTTRLTVPDTKDVDLLRADDYRLVPAKPHTSLILMTVLTQLSVGGFLTLFLAELFAATTAQPREFASLFAVGPVAMLVTVSLALATSVFHLGRPLFAYRALKMWRRSWLSREVLFFGAFAFFAGLYGVVRWQKLPIPSALSIALGCLVALTGIAGIYSSARIYMVPARPSWNGARTPIAFFSTAWLLGSLATLLVFTWQSHTLAVPILERGGGVVGKGLIGILIAAGLVQIGALLVNLFNILSRDEHELMGTAKLLTQRFRTALLARLGSLLVTLVALPLALLGLSSAGGAHGVASPLSIALLLGLALASELLGRYLFFVTVVPKNRPEGYFA